jgi:hypothetical protein
MGGIGSGRPRRAFVAAEDTLQLPIGALRQAGLLGADPPAAADLTWCPRNGDEEPAVVHVAVGKDGQEALLEYNVVQVDGTQKQMCEAVRMTTSRTHRGGERRWFCCPICERRVGGLYLPPGQEYFACRHCHNLDYLCRHSVQGTRQAAISVNCLGT